MSRYSEQPTESDIQGSDLLDAFREFYDNSRALSESNTHGDGPSHDDLKLKLSDRAYEYYEKEISIVRLGDATPDVIRKIRTTNGRLVEFVDSVHGYLDFNQVALYGRLALCRPLPRFLAPNTSPHLNVNRWRRYEVSPYRFASQGSAELVPNVAITIS